MGMPGFNSSDDDQPFMEINTTPLVDVMLVLLVIFLVSAPVLTQAIDLQLPNEIATEIADPHPIQLSITASGGYFWKDEPVSDQELDARLQAAAAADKNQAIHLSADVNVNYGRVSKILAMAQKYGLKNIGFVTRPE